MVSVKKKLIVLILSVLVTVNVFAAGVSNVPSRGSEIIVMKGSVVVWHAKTGLWISKQLVMQRF